jgi:hypothetical protein
MTTPGTLTLSKAILRTWDWGQIVLYCNLSLNTPISPNVQTLQPFHLQTLSIHDLVRMWNIN